MITFGPVPSRRLGRSFGINNIPPKICTYSCVYCQVGKTHKMQIERRPFYEASDVYKRVKTQVKKAWGKGESIDNLAFQVFQKKLNQVEYLIGYEGDAFTFTGNVEEDLLSITSVHPMRESAVMELLKKSNSDFSTVHKLITQNKLVETDYGGQKYYLRK